MFYLIVAGILALLAVLAIAGTVFAKRHNKAVTRSSEKLPAGGFAATAVVLVLLLGIFTVANSITTVEARSVAVQTSFGQYTDTLDNGLSFIAPWSSTEEFTTQVQFTELSDGSGALGEAVKVNFQDGSTGRAAVVARWSITQEGAEPLWRQHQTFERVENNLVASSVRNSTINVFAKYTPIEARGDKVAELPENILAELKDRLGKAGIQVDSVSINDVALDERAQASLNSIRDANNNIERAEAEEQQAIIEARTAQTRQAVLSPQILQQNCIDMLNGWDANKQGPVPPTLNCNFGGADPAQIVPVN